MPGPKRLVIETVAGTVELLRRTGDDRHVCEVAGIVGAGTLREKESRLRDLLRTGCRSFLGAGGLFFSVTTTLPVALSLARYGEVVPGPETEPAGIRPLDTVDTDGDGDPETVIRAYGFVVDRALAASAFFSGELSQFEGFEFRDGDARSRRASRQVLPIATRWHHRWWGTLDGLFRLVETVPSETDVRIVADAMFRLASTVFPLVCRAFSETRGLRLTRNQTILLSDRLARTVADVAEDGEETGMIDPIEADELRRLGELS